MAQSHSTVIICSNYGITEQWQQLSPTIKEKKHGGGDAKGTAAAAQQEDESRVPKPHLGILCANYALLLLGVHSQLSPGESH